MTLAVLRLLIAIAQALLPRLLGAGAITTDAHLRLARSFKDAEDLTMAALAARDRVRIDARAGGLRNDDGFSRD